MISIFAYNVFKQGYSSGTDDRNRSGSSQEEVQDLPVPQVCGEGEGWGEGGGEVHN